MLPQCHSGISPVISEQLLILKENLELLNADDVAEACVGCRKMRKLKGQRRGCRTIKLRKLDC